MSAETFYVLADLSLWLGFLLVLALPTALIVAVQVARVKEGRQFARDLDQARKEGRAARDLDRHADQAIAIASGQTTTTPTKEGVH